MDNLLKDRLRSGGTKKRNKKNAAANVVYSLDGRAVKGKLRGWRKGAAITGIIFSLLVVTVYVPPMFYRSPSENTDVPITPDAGAIKTYQTYLKDNPDADFDDDGLDNTLEEEYGTDPWDIDTDGDGVSDYAELYITETSPTEMTAVLAKQVKADDEKNGDSLATPYKIDDIIFWPDNYSSKAYGTVVRTLSGYRFCHYSGWVRFPETVYAYGYRDGVHYELEHRENEDAWRIDSSDEVFLYAEPLDFVHCLKLPFVGTVYLEDDWMGRLLTKILPDKGGLVTCYKAAVADTQKDDGEQVTATLRSPLINRDDPTRFCRNMDTLRDLSWVRKLIEANECVAASLYSENAGESIGIVYGYTGSGDLLVANEKLEPVGTLHISEYAMNVMGKDGETSQESWFEFSGLGFDSVKYGDHISFFASTLTDPTDGTAPSALEAAASQGDTAVVVEKEIETECTTEAITEDMAETTTEAATEDTTETATEAASEEGTAETTTEDTTETTTEETGETGTEPESSTVATFGF